MWRFFARVSLLVVALASGAFALAVPAEAVAAYDTIDSWVAGADTPSGRYCLAVAGGSKLDNAAIVLYDDCSSLAESRSQWRAVWVTGFSYKIQNVNSSKCLAVANGSTAIGAAIVQLTCSTSNKTRLWYFAPEYAVPNTSWVTIRNAASDKCITPDGGIGANNRKIVLWNCDGDPSRRWVSGIYDDWWL